ncbi:MAG: glycosyltransferase family 39 protein [Gemmatimonadota bacterium]|jgi:hypothetical protein
MISSTSTARERSSALLAARVFAGLLMALATLWVVQYTTWPLAADQGFWLWVGEVITKGGWPYVDAWDIKGPFPFYVGALTHLLFGRTEWGIRVVDLIFVLGACIAIARLPMVRRRAVAVFAAPLAFLFWYGSLDVWRTAQPDGWAGILILLAVGAIAGREEPGSFRYLAVGVLIGAAALVKPTFAIFLALPVVIALGGGRRPARHRARGPAISVLGFVLALAATATAFAAAGALHELIDADILYVLGTYRNADAFAGGPVAGFLGMLRVSPLWLATPLVLIGLRELWGRDRDSFHLLVVWILLVLVDIAVQGKYWPYHGLPALVPLAVAAGIGVDTAFQSFRPGLRGPDRWRQAIGVVLVVAACAQAIAVPLRQTATSLGILAGLLPADAIFMKNAAVNSRGPDSLSGIAAYVRERTAPGQPVLAMSNLVVINYLADRPSPTRFGMTRGILDGGDNPYRRRYREEFQAALSRHPPEYIILPSSEACAAAATGSFIWRNCLNDYVWLDRLRRSRYRRETTRGAFDILRRKPDTVPVAHG